MDKKGVRFKFKKYYIIGLIIFSLIITGATYAFLYYRYENSVAIKGNVIAIDADLTVELVVGNNKKLVPLKDDALSNAINGVGSDNGACIDSNGNLSCQVYKITLTNNGSRLQGLVGTIELYAKGSGSTYTNLKWRELTNSTTVKDGSVINGMEKSTLIDNLTLDSGEEVVYYVAVYIQEIDGNQVNSDKGEFEGTVTFETGDGTTAIGATADIINLYNDGSSINTVHIGGDESKPEVKLNATQGIMLDNNGDYRYYGADPNNYVTFNGETWRIIGTFNNVDDGTGNKETRLKIIRDESIGNYSWDSSASTVNSGNGVNDWSKADLMTELNTLYYNSTSGTCYNGQNNASTTCNFTSTGLDSTARSMIDDAVYHLGGSSNASGLYADDNYNAERGTTVYSCSTDDGACPRATTWTGKIGIMYPSDYAYAVDLSLCTKDGYNYDNSTCKSNDWLYLGSNEWTIMPASSRAYYAFGVISSGYVNVINVYFYNSYAARPVLYLKSDVTIVGGEGTSSNPYQLG